MQIERNVVGVGEAKKKDVTSNVSKKCNNWQFRVVLQTAPRMKEKKPQHYTLSGSTCRSSSKISRITTTAKKMIQNLLNPLARSVEEAYAMGG
jgi:hypothetical protein